MKALHDFVSRPFSLAIASDHGGFELKNRVATRLRERGLTIDDVGPDHLDPADDYPDFASALARKVSAADDVAGILICRRGIGMSVAANRLPYVRAALATDPATAAASRDHNCSNVLVIGADSLDDNQVDAIVDAWLATPFSGDERHARRLSKVETGTRDDIAALRTVDPEIAGWMDKEEDRQESILELIASENVASPAVRAAQGSVLTNKYAEGYPGKRYYGGCEFVDEVESLAIKRALEIFGAETANVQPHSGSQANMAAYFAMLQPGDTVLGMDLAHGGHLTHGLKVNFSGRMYNFVNYGVSRETEQLDYDEIARLALEHKPKLLLAGASAYPRIIDFARLREIADSVDAYFMVDMAHIAGLVAAGLHPNPVPYCDIVTTTTHKTLRGPRGGMILAREKWIKKVNSQIFPGIQGGPLMHVIAGKAVCFHEAQQPSFKAYQKQVVANAKTLAKALEGHGFRIVSGGTDNHLMMVDLRPLGTTGKVAELALDESGITVNKNLIPFDPEKPTVASGLRIGTPAVTTRGLTEPHMVQLAEWIHRVVANLDDESVKHTVKAEVAALTSQFPLPTI